MKVRQTETIDNTELPLQFSIDFKQVFLMYEKYAGEEFKTHPYHPAAKQMISEFKNFPELINGFSDFTLLEKHEDIIELLLKPIFPEVLTNNEIKSASIPFSFTSFMFTKRFEQILEDAGEDFTLLIRNLEEDLLYIHACTMILGMVHGYSIDVKRPFFFDIPDKDGVIKHYRVAFNADMCEIVATENAPKITEEDYKLLIDNFDNVAIWREKFPPNSYIFKGFGIMNLFDVTTDVAISDIRDVLLRSDDNLVPDLQTNFAKFYGITDLKFGFSAFEVFNKKNKPVKFKKSQSLLINNSDTSAVDDFFCEGIMNRLFNDQDIIAISDIEKYGEMSSKNDFYKHLVAQEFGSIMLIPIKSKTNEILTVMEIASPRPYELNSININKLKDIIPVFESTIERITKEHQNVLEATIQKYYTTIHPTVKWRFYEAAENLQHAKYNHQENIKMDEIVFEDIYPLYGQSDIRGSSVARNESIRDDLTTQLELAIGVLNEALKTEKLPIYSELTFRINEYLDRVKKRLRAGDEIGILDFLKRDIYPTFSHIRDINSNLSKVIDVYMSRLDKDLQVVYEKRKAYENSVTLLNNKLANFLDRKQQEAQDMFPHYFERYKTDGVEYNMYIGQSLLKSKKYDKLYLDNLKLWQLQTMFEMENVAQSTRKDMGHDLQIASLILVHSNSLAIKFRMDEKQFDVDGAYNIRYEIIKKRIDKANIKGSKDRLTTPGKIAIVYSQEKEAQEYMKYIKYLQSKNYLGTVEALDLEDLQGVSGLKALRVEVIYQTDYDEKLAITMDKLIEEIQHTE